jgi:hypothetical protein
MILTMRRRMIRNKRMRAGTWRPRAAEFPILFPNS